MNTTLRSTLLLAAALVIPLAASAACSHEIAHSDSDKPNWTGGRTHESTTVYKNADGSLSTEHSSQSTQ